MAKRKVAIGTRMRSMKEMRKALKSKQGGLVKFIPKDGDLTVRFIQEPEGNWVKYIEHWDQVSRASFPCVGEPDCPGCEDGMRKSERFLANALDVSSDKVVALQLPKSLASTLVKYYEKYDTLLDRDYELSREGAGTDTEYFVAPEGKVKRSLTKYEALDLEGLLEQLAESYLGESSDDEDEDDDEDEAPKARPKRTKSAAAPSAKPKRKPAPVEEDDDDEDDDEDEDDEPPAKKRPAKKAASKPVPKKSPAKRKPVVEEDDDEDDDEDEDDEDEYDDEDDDEEDDDDSDDDDDDEDEDDDEDDEDSDDDYYTESELQAMNLGQLRVVAKEYGIKTTGLKKDELIDAILEG